MNADSPPIRAARDEADRISAWLEDRLYEFNVEATGFADGESLCFTIEECGRVIAGIAGHTWGGSCEIKQVWVEAASRGRGFGHALLARAEAEARRRGCRQIVLTTHSFQAPAWYRSLGFAETGRVKGYPRGYDSITLVKRLEPGA